jgi:hypothetical protein
VIQQSHHPSLLNEEAANIGFGPQAGDGALDDARCIVALSLGQEELSHTSPRQPASDAMAADGLRASHGIRKLTRLVVELPVCMAAS